jgi:esterase/lipase
MNNRKVINAEQARIIHNCKNTKEKLLNHLKPTGHVMHYQFNIQQLYALPTLYLSVLYGSENKQRLVPLTA